MGDTLRALEAAYAHAVDWVESVPNRPVAAAATAEQLLTLLDRPLPAEPTDPAEVINMLAATAEKGLVATPSGRFLRFRRRWCAPGGPCCRLADQRLGAERGIRSTRADRSCR